MLRAGVVAVLAAGSLVALPTAAFAEDPAVTIVTLSNASLKSGDQANLQYRVVNRNVGTTTFTVQVNTPDGISCSGACNLSQEIQPGNNGQTFNATLKAGNVGAGQTKSGTLKVTASFDNGGVLGNGSGSATRQMTVQGPEAPSSVAEISGKVTDQATGDGIANALVGILDENNKSYNTTASSSGSFKFTGSAGRPIAPGEIQITAQKDGWTAQNKTITVGAGGAARNLKVTMKLTATPSASASAEASTEAPSEEATGGDAGESAAAGPVDASNASDGGGFLSWLLIILGGLLVALGIGAIVLLLVRRRRNEDDELAEPAMAGAGAATTPGSRGVYRGADDATRITRPDGTMAARNAALADAPTTMLRPAVDDEFPDPYGAPPMRAGQNAGYGAPTQVGGWTEEPEPGYRGGAGGYGPASGAGAGAYGPASGAGAGAYGQASGGGAYGGGQYANPRAGDGYVRGDYPTAGGAPAGYGQDQYDEPTGRYDRNGAAYGQQPAAGGYDDGYADQGYPDQRGGYGPEQQAYGRGGAGYADQGGYDQRADQRGGYGAAPADEYDQRGGYDQRAAGYAGGGDGYGANGYVANGYGGNGDGGYRGAASAAGGAGGGQYGGGYGADQGAYEQAEDYDRIPPQRGGYDQRGGYAGGGAADQGGYYEEEPTSRSSRHAAPPPPPSNQRRTVDWLDD